MTTDLSTPRTTLGEGESIEVRYALAERDAIHSYRQGLLARPQSLVALIFFGILVGLVAGAAGGPAPALATVAAVLILMGGFVPWWTGRQAGSNAAFRGPHRLRISAEGVEGWTEGVGKTHLHWPQLAQIRTSASHVLLYWHTGGTTLIPKAAFATAEGAEELVRKARTWRAEAKGT